MVAIESSNGLENTPRMVRWQNGTLHCYMSPCTHKSILLFMTVFLPYLLTVLLLFNNASMKGHYLEYFLLVCPFAGMPGFLYCDVSISGMYITKLLNVYSVSFPIRKKIDMSKVEGIIIADATSSGHTSNNLTHCGVFTYYRDHYTKERMSSILLVKKIEEPMRYVYYFDQEFLRCFPYHVVGRCMYDENFLAELLNINPNIRVLNKTTRSIKSPSVENEFEDMEEESENNN